jgi:glycosyltransferase involved in cell wall biosynthesis
MRVAVVSQFTSPGGGARFLRGLCMGLLNQGEATEVGLFIDGDAASREGLLSLLPESERLKLHLMDSRGALLGPVELTPRYALRRLRSWARRQPLLVRSYRAIRYRALQGTAAASLPRVTLSDGVVAAISEYDVAYFPWPRQVVPPPMPRALVGTFHDFNHRHRFGNYRPQDIDLLDAEMREWLCGRVQPITSTHFIADELNAFYPARTHAPQVVYLSTFAIHNPGPDEVASVRTHFGLPECYVVCPTNVGPHKNVISLLSAAGRMKRNGTVMPLVLTGSGTQCLGVDARRDPLYASIFKDTIDELNGAIEREGLAVGEDIWPVGYVTDAQMDALVRGAVLLVAPSRYEAGSGPALDAWWLGTPVASSALPPVLEQMAFLGTEAVLFEPDDVSGMTAALTQALADRDAMQAMAKRSRDAMAHHTWDKVAEEYIAIFRRAVAQGASPQEDGGDSALEDRVTRRLLDQAMLDERSFRRFRRSLPGQSQQSKRLWLACSLRRSFRRIPLVGPVARALYRQVLRGDL